MAKSTSPGVSRIEEYVFRPDNTDNEGFTGYTIPLNPSLTRFEVHRYPGFCGLEDAPITAMELGLNM